jgi:ParB-like chromosome segregation protein Spo0J
MNSDNLQEIHIDLLGNHPEYSNFMDTETLRKLRLHIERTGRYEPLTVRKHPVKDGRFQIINGHNRVQVLRTLGYETVQCVVWSINDDQARLYLATLNRLAGKEIPERRAVLLDNLCKVFTGEELAGLLPDSKKQIEELRRLSRLEPEDILKNSESGGRSVTPVLLSFMLEDHEAKTINLALDLAMQKEKIVVRSRALFVVARSYLE